MGRKRAASPAEPEPEGGRKRGRRYETVASAYAQAVDAADALDAQLVAAVAAREKQRAATGATLTKIYSKTVPQPRQVVNRPWLKLLEGGKKQEEEEEQKQQKQQQEEQEQKEDPNDPYVIQRKLVERVEKRWYNWTKLDEEGKAKYIERYGGPPKRIPDELPEFVARPANWKKADVEGELPDAVTKLIEIKKQQKSSIPPAPPTTDAQKAVTKMDPKLVWQLSLRAVWRDKKRKYRLKKMNEEQKAQHYNRIKLREMAAKIIGIDEDMQKPILLKNYQQQEIAPANETPGQRKLRKAAERAALIQMRFFYKLSEEKKKQYLERQRSRELQRMVEQAQKDDLRIRNPNVKLKPHIALAMQILDRRAEAVLESQRRYARELRRRKNMEMQRRRRTNKRQRLRLRRLRKDPLALVRERMPIVWKRPPYADKLWLKWNSEEDRDMLTLMQERIECEYTKCMWCATCRWARKGGHKFQCRRGTCVILFDDPLDMMEHQITEHGRIFLKCRACLEKLGFTTIGSFSVMPPVTVYMWSQLFRPAHRPEPWTSLDQVEVERLLFTKKVEGLKPLMRRYVVKSLNTAIARVERGGLSELRTQYEVAMEHYKSALVTPAGDARACSDGSIEVGPGKNWLLSSEPEDSQYLNQFRFHGFDKLDEASLEHEDEEIELFSTYKKKPKDSEQEAAAGWQNLVSHLQRAPILV